MIYPHKKLVLPLQKWEILSNFAHGKEQESPRAYIRCKSDYLSFLGRIRSVPLEAPLLLPRVGEIEDSTAGYSAIEGNTITNKFHY